LFGEAQGLRIKRKGQDMNIKIGNYRIESDKNQFVLYENRKKRRLGTKRQKMTT